jgi:thiosulfate/3-mercaptopyruvate sulfurtransferase
MSGKVLISPSELSDLMKAEPVVLIDTRDPAIYSEAHIPGASMSVRSSPTLQAQHRRA